MDEDTKIEWIGDAKKCPRCRDTWPLDAEFFRRLTDGRWHSYCRACEAEWIAEKRITNKQSA